MIKYKNKKTRCPKNYRFTAKEVAEIAGVSESYVKKIRDGHAKVKSPKAQQIIAIDQILSKGSNQLIKEVERIVQL